MLSDIIYLLQLDSGWKSSRVIVTKETQSCDSSFIISHTLGHCIKNKKAVLIVSLHHSLEHYKNVGLKMNYSLQKYIDSDLVSFYNLAEGLVNKFLRNQKVFLEDCFSEVKEQVKKLQEKNGDVSIIVDGVSHLLDLHYSLKEVNKFCSDIIELVREFQSSVVTFHCNVVSDEDISYVLANLLTYKAYTVVEVENLASGRSADVSGHITISHSGKKFEDEHMFVLDVMPSKYLFKLFDRGVKMFAPGTV